MRLTWLFRWQLAALVALGALSPVARASAAGNEAGGSDAFKGLELRGLGPALMSGRIADIAVHPRDQSTWYVAVGSGGVWKTENAGTTWQPLFDRETSYSIGCLTIDPNHPEIVWVGTGENVGGRHVGYGDGVYRSLDGGGHWTRMGLERSEHIGRIVVDPHNSDVVYVAAQGPLWSAGGDRGLFKTIDGGKTWAKILGGGDYTGVNEVVMDPRDPDVLYASTHQRFRTVAALVNGGPESGIHKSVDGGKTWRRLEKGMPEGDLGKIGLAISPQNPSVIYATIELPHRKGAFYRSEDGGGSWQKCSDYAAGGTGAHYYNEIFASPHQFDRVYHMDVQLHVTEDGGRTFRSIEGAFKHVDNHALAFDPHDPDYLLAGCDGGLYQSWDLGAHWAFVANLPVTQFYKVALDNAVPFYNVYGGTQDNNTQGGPSRTDNVHGIRNSDWFITIGGDGHQPAVDPSNPDIVYSQSQQGHLWRHDRRTGEVVFIQPQPAAGEPAERFNWDSPILVSPHDPVTLFFASQRLWRSDDRGDSWRAISPDLSRGLDRLTLPMMGRVWSIDAVWDLAAMSKYGSITSLAQSPLDANLLYAGTDDGLIQVSEDGGATWRKTDRLPGGAEKFFVNDIKADLHDASTVYVAVDQHKQGDFSPYLLKSTDRGRSWKSIAGDLPPRHLVWRLVQDHEKPSLLFAGTEFGLFFTVDGGGKWTKLQGGVPNIPFRDLAIQRRENDLVGATFGRGFFILDDYAPLRQVSDALLKQDAALFPVRKAQWYVERRTLGDELKASQGDAFFTAPNPPFGAVFTYYLRDDMLTAKAARQQQEKERAKAGADTPYPGWEALREERLEEEPAVVLTVRDAAGRVVRRLTGPATAGFHRVAWDLRLPPVDPWTGDKPAGEWDEPPRGVLAAPGAYSVGISVRKRGVLADLGTPQTFEVVPLRMNSLTTLSAAEVAAFLAEVAALDRDVQAAGASIDESLRKLQGIKAALMQSRVADAALDDQARGLERQLRDVDELLNGNRERMRFNEPGPPSIVQRLQVVTRGSSGSTYGPTPTLRMNLDIARREFAGLQRQLDALVRVAIPALEQALDAAGVPWTPGRGAGPGNR